MGKHRTDATMSDPRRTRRPPPVWMAINRFRGLCWCGKPKRLWDFGMRKYCSKRHADIWFDGVCPLWSDVRIRIIERDGAKCTICGKRGEPGESSLNPYLMLHVDHIIPYAAGGDFWDWSNLQVLCADCHGAKTSKDSGTIKYSRWARGSIPIDAWMDD